MYDEILLAGNPNVGKTSVFNRLTRSSEHVGNWHGVTVDEKSKIIRYEDKVLKITDLPGLYSLTEYSPEEGVAISRIMNCGNAVVAVICEARNIKRNLFLALQLLEAGRNVMIVVNMADEIEKSGGKINCGALSEALGVPVVATSAKYGKRAFDILSVAKPILNAAPEKRYAADYLKDIPLAKTRALTDGYARAADLPCEWAAIKALEGDEWVIKRLKLPSRIAEKMLNENLRGEICAARYNYIDKITEGLVVYGAGKNSSPDGNKTGLCAFDRIALGKYFALPLFLAVIMAVFAVTFGLPGRFLSELTGLAIDKYLYAPVAAALKQSSCPMWLADLVCEGIINGLSGIVVFLPQIVLLFFFLAMMEDSGYVARVAFMTDGLFGKIGLSGKSAITLLMGFGCSATAVLTSRGLEDENMRKKTALITPFMSCSARLPVYLTIGGAFFAANWLVIFFLYLLGACTAVIFAAVMEKCIPALKSGRPAFIMEMPPYRIPTAERVFQILAANAAVFLVKVGTVIFALDVIVWVLSNFSLTDGYGGAGDSIMTVVGKAVAVLFEPLGFGSWQAVTSLLSGFVAKEAVVGAIQSLGGVKILFAGDTAPADAAAFMVFTLLYVPCAATISALIKEVGLKWTLVGAGVQMVTAYIAAFVVRSAVLFTMRAPGFAAAFAVIAAFTAVAAVLTRADKCCAVGCRLCDRKCKKSK